MELYRNTINRSASLYNGSKYYQDRYVTVKGHPNYASEHTEIGELIFKGQYYWDIELLYNIHRDAVVITHYDENGYYTEIELKPEDVTWFRLTGSEFKRIVADPASGKAIPEGYYRIVYEGNSMALIKHRKTIEIKESNAYRREFFKERTLLYVRVDDVYHQIRKKKSLIKALESREKEMKNFLRRNNMTIRENATAETIMALRYYDSLNSDE
jgi:hypothetical protein